MAIKAEILSVGTELLLGDIVNTNAAFLSKGLASLGIHLYRQGVVGDNPSRLEKEIEGALSRCELLLITGGLGPTGDDLTREAVARVLGKSLIKDEKILQEIQGFFDGIGVKMEKSNIKQSYVPEGGVAIPNKNGTSPGILLEAEKKVVILMPGPPKEMEPMFVEEVLPYLTKYQTGLLESKVLRIFGIGESTMEAMIEDLIVGQSNPTVAPYCMEQGLILRITAKADTKEEAEKYISSMEEKLRERLGKYVYGVNNESLEEVVVEKLQKAKLSISMAESCTGGRLASVLTGVPGVSKLFPLGVVTYSNESKISVLGVRKSTLNIHGAVSKEVAEEMAKGIRSKGDTDIGVAITGIAGPGGGSEEKPVGLVHIALDYRGEMYHLKKQLFGHRSEIQQRATGHALDLIRRVVEEK